MTAVRAHLTALLGEPETYVDGDYNCFARTDDDGLFVTATDGLDDLSGHRSDPRELVMTASGLMQVASATYLMSLCAHVLRGSGVIDERYLGNDGPILDPDFSTVCGLLLFEREELGPLTALLDVPDGDGFRFLFAVPVLHDELSWIIASSADAPAALRTYAATLADTGTAADLRRGPITLP